MNSFLAIYQGFSNTLGKPISKRLIDVRRSNNCDSLKYKLMKRYSYERKNDYDQNKTMIKIITSHSKVLKDYLVFFCLPLTGNIVLSNVTHN